jgi:hypothetical protein
VVLDAAIEPHQLAVDVVEHFDAGRLPLEQDRGAAGKSLDVAAA